MWMITLGVFLGLVAFKLVWEYRDKILSWVPVVLFTVGTVGIVGGGIYFLYAAKALGMVILSTVYIVAGVLAFRLIGNPVCKFLLVLRHPVTHFRRFRHSRPSA